MTKISQGKKPVGRSNAKHVAIAVSHRVMKVILRAYQVGIRTGDVELRSGVTVKVVPGKGEAVIQDDLNLSWMSNPSTRVIDYPTGRQILVVIRGNMIACLCDFS